MEIRYLQEKNSRKGMGGIHSERNILIIYILCKYYIYFKQYFNKKNFYLMLLFKIYTK